MSVDLTCDMTETKGRSPAGLCLGRGRTRQSGIQGGGAFCPCAVSDIFTALGAYTKRPTLPFTSEHFYSLATYLILYYDKPDPTHLISILHPYRR
jgi:hypothetical protein